MHVILYKYLGEKNRVDKSSFLTLVLDTSGEFKASVSILNPTLLLKLPTQPKQLLEDENGNEIDEVQLDDGTATRVLDFNYFYVEEFRRYYYLTSFIVSSNHLATITGVVDPLFSFKDGILENEAYIERNEFTFHETEEDSLIPLMLKKEVREYVPDDGAKINTTFSFNIPVEPNEMKLMVSVAVAGNSGVDKIIYSADGLATLNTKQMGDAAGTTIFALDVDEARTLIGRLMGAYSSYATFFKSLVVYPFVMDDTIGDLVDVGIWKAKEDGTYEYVTLGLQGKYNTTTSKYRIIADFYLPNIETFLDYEPYTRYEIYLPFYGWYSLSYVGLEGHRLLVYYAVNYENGSAEVYIEDFTDRKILFSAPCQVGIPLSLSSTNAEEIAAQKTALQNNMILGLVGAGISLVGSVIAVNPAGALAAGAQGVGALVQYQNQTSLLFQRAQSTHNGSAGAAYSSMYVKVRITRAKVRQSFDLSKFAHQYGRPLREIRKLNTLSGFTLVSSIHLEELGAFDSEKAEIEASLLSGVLL